MKKKFSAVIPAKAGIQSSVFNTALVATLLLQRRFARWIPAFAGMTILVFSLCAHAATLPEASSIEAYLNGLTTLQSRFEQTDNAGNQTTGKFYLYRPGRLRFEYDAPVEDFIVADGTFVYYYDSKMKQKSYMPISKSLANFFLRPTLSLSGDISVSGEEMEGDLVALTLTQTKDPLSGNLTLFFTPNPLALKKWRIVDAQGLTTVVELFDTEAGTPISKNLFHYYDPDLKNPSVNK